MEERVFYPISAELQAVEVAFERAMSERRSQLMEEWYNKMEKALGIKGSGKRLMIELTTPYLPEPDVIVEVEDA
jgi:hypothetical protein